MATTENIKHRLSQYHLLEVEYMQIRRILERLRKTHERYSFPQSLELEALYEKNLTKIENERQYIQTMLNTLEGDAHKVMMYRYINGLEWWKVAEAMNYSERSVHRIHNDALATLSNYGKEG